MMLYRIDNTSNLKIIGQNPQIGYAITIGNLFLGGEGIYGPIKVQFAETPEYVINKKAKLTDFISGGSDNIKLTISPKFYFLIKQYLGFHQVWDIKLSNDVYKFDRKNVAYIRKEGSIQELYDYKILHISYPTNFIINHSKSEYFLDDRDNYYKMVAEYKGEIPQSYMQDATHQSVKIKTEEDYQLLNEKLKKDNENDRIIIPRKLVFDISKLDTEIFRIITPINNLSGYYVTENLKNKIEENGLTGMDFKPLSQINPQVAVDFI